MLWFTLTLTTIEIPHMIYLLVKTSNLYNYTSINTIGNYKAPLLKPL